MHKFNRRRGRLDFLNFVEHDLSKFIKELEKLFSLPDFTTIIFSSILSLIIGRLPFMIFEMIKKIILIKDIYDKLFVFFIFLSPLIFLVGIIVMVVVNCLDRDMSCFFK